MNGTEWQEFFGQFEKDGLSPWQEAEQNQEVRIHGQTTDRLKQRGAAHFIRPHGAPKIMIERMGFASCRIRDEMSKSRAGHLSRRMSISPSLTVAASCVRI